MLLVLSVMKGDRPRVPPRPFHLSQTTPPANKDVSDILARPAVSVMSHTTILTLTKYLLCFCKKMVCEFALNAILSDRYVLNHKNTEA